MERVATRENHLLLSTRPPSHDEIFKAYRTHTCDIPAKKGIILNIRPLLFCQLWLWLLLESSELSEIEPAMVCWELPGVAI
jgi:hypothetical protein